jgi:hypothetical protein
MTLRDDVKLISVFDEIAVKIARELVTEGNAVLFAPTDEIKIEDCPYGSVHDQVGNVAKMVIAIAHDNIEIFRERAEKAGSHEIRDQPPGMKQ